MAKWEHNMMIGAAAAAASVGAHSVSAEAVDVQTTIVTYAQPVVSEKRVGIPVDPDVLRQAVERSNIPDEYFDEDLDDV